MSGRAPDNGVRAASRLLGLPRELRNHIYDMLFHNTCFKFTQRRLSITLAYGSSANPSSALPVWLLSNKQILEEGLEQLYYKARCVRCLRQEYVSGLKFNLQSGRYEQQPQPADNPRALLSLSRIRIVDLQDIALSTYTTDRLQTPATFFICDRDGFRFLFQYLLSEGKTLSYLKLSFILPTVYELLFRPEDWKADLFELEALGRAKRVQLILREPHLRASRPDHTKACRAAITQLQRELVRTARFMVVEKESGCHVSNWMERANPEVDDADGSQSQHVLNEWHLEVTRGRQAGDDVRLCELKVHVS